MSRRPSSELAPLVERYPAPPRRPPRRLLRRALPAERPGHRTTTAHACALYPFMAEGGLGPRGAYVGVDAYGGSFVYDPWELYGRVITDPNMCVLGRIGKAKSSLVKTMIARQRVFGRSAQILDPKGEYATLTEALGGTQIKLRPDGPVRLNPLTRANEEPVQQALLSGVTAAALGRELRPEEAACAREALRLLNGERDADPCLPEVVELMLSPAEAMASKLATDRDSLAAAAREAALALQRLCEGDLRGMFDAPTTAGIDVGAPVVTIDLSEVQDSAALGILMACAAAWQRAQIEELRRRAEDDGVDGPKILNVLDECWRLFKHLGIGRYLQESFKLARARGVQNVMVMHRLSDLDAAGPRDSEEVRLAEGLVADTETRVIYAQPRGEAERLRDVLGLSDTAIALSRSLGRGEALWQVGERLFLVLHRRSPWEVPLTDTDARMASGGGEG